MIVMTTIYITLYDRLTHNDLGRGYLLWHSIVNDI